MFSLRFCRTPGLSLAPLNGYSVRSLLYSKCAYSVNNTMKYTKRAHVISFCKTCTWRVVASLDTFLLSWLITGNIGMGASIASLEVLTKMFLYYAHERQWEKPRFNEWVVEKYMWVAKLIRLK